MKKIEFICFSTILMGTMISVESCKKKEDVLPAQGTDSTTAISFKSDTTLVNHSDTTQTNEVHTDTTASTDSSVTDTASYTNKLFPVK